MSKALFYLQLGAKEEIGFGHPFGALPGWQVYDMDNHADAITLQYARRLLDEAEEVVLVFRQHSVGNGLGGIAGFLDQAMRGKKELLTVYSIGKIDLPAGMKKRLEMAETTVEGVMGQLKKKNQ